jgi:hypothetical protein
MNDVVTLSNLLQRNAHLVTKKCVFEQVKETDATFIYNLRNNHQASFLRKSDGNALDQKKYLINYEQKFKNGEEIYYKVRNRVNSNVEAVVRLTELKNFPIFNWESLISVEGSDPTTPIEVMLTIYKIGFEILGCEQCGPWDVDKKHSTMQQIHKIVGMAEPISESDRYFKYAVFNSDYVAKIAKFNRMGFAQLVGVD